MLLWLISLLALVGSQSDGNSDLVKGRMGTRLGLPLRWWTMLKDGSART